MVKTAVITISTLLLMFLAAVGTVFAQSASPSMKPSASPSVSPSASPRAGSTVVVPSGAPSTGHAL